MKRALYVSLLGILLANGLAVKAASIGDPAPPLTIERWIKGAPVKVGPGENIFVVDLVRQGF